MSKVHIPPIKIQGIKTKIIPLIKDIASRVEYNTWVEPFLGSGVVGFNICPKKAIFSDSNPYIIDFYNAVKNKKITSVFAREFLLSEGKKLEQLDGEYYYEVRDRFNKKHDPLDFLFLNRSNFNGMIRFNRKGEFNVPYGHKPKRFAQAYVTKICNQIEYVQNVIIKNNWSFLCQPFTETLKLISDKDLIYSDPPYIGRHVDYFDSWDENLEKELYNSIVRTNAKFILSTWHHNKFRKNEYVNLIWKDCNIETTEHFYFVGAKEKNRNTIVEALLYNF